MTTPEHVPDPDAVADYETQAREFLAKGPGILSPQATCIRHRKRAGERRRTWRRP